MMDLKELYKIEERNASRKSYITKDAAVKCVAVGDVISELILSDLRRGKAKLDYDVNGLVLTVRVPFDTYEVYMPPEANRIYKEHKLELDKDMQYCVKAAILNKLDDQIKEYEWIDMSNLAVIIKSAYNKLDRIACIGEVKVIL